MIGFAQRTAVLVLLSLLIGGYAHAAKKVVKEETPYELKGVVLGMTKDQLTAHFSGHLICHTKDSNDQGPEGSEFCNVNEHDNPDAAEQQSVAGEKAYPSYLLQDGKLVAILVDLLDTENFDATLQALTEKYGRAKVSVIEYQNGFGARFSKRLAVWNNGVSQISFAEKGPIDGKSSLRLYLMSFYSKFYPSQDEKAKAARSDL